MWIYARGRLVNLQYVERIDIVNDTSEDTLDYRVRAWSRDESFDLFIDQESKRAHEYFQILGQTLSARSLDP